VIRLSSHAAFTASLVGRERKAHIHIVRDQLSGATND
jgi:hypothetical protein